MAKKSISISVPPWNTEAVAWETEQSKKTITIVSATGETIATVQSRGELAENDGRIMSLGPDAIEALQKWEEFWDDMPKGQLGKILLGKIVCNVGLLNEAFILTENVLRRAGVK